MDRISPVDILKELLDVKSDSDLAELLGYTKQAISAARKQGRITEGMLKTAAEKSGLSRTELRMRLTEPPTTNDGPSNMELWRQLEKCLEANRILIAENMRLSAGGNVADILRFALVWQQIFKDRNNIPDDLNPFFFEPEFERLGFRQKECNALPEIQGIDDLQELGNVMFSAWRYCAISKFDADKCRWFETAFEKMSAFARIVFEKSQDSQK